MYLNRHKSHPISKGSYDHAKGRTLYQLRSNILPVVAMLMLLSWASIQTGKMIDESKQSNNESVGLAK